MGYREQLELAAQWLVSVQNPDKGWGLAVGQGSSIVNTSEAVYILLRATNVAYTPYIMQGLDFLAGRTLMSLQQQPRTRYAFFALFATRHAIVSGYESHNQSCVDWLLSARNADGGWGHEANDQRSMLYPTAMSLLALNAHVDSRILATARNWIVNQSSGNGWRFSDDDSFSMVATAIATTALATDLGSNQTILKRAKEMLLGTSLWGVHSEDMPGTPWMHAAQMWIFSALVALDCDPYHSTIANGVRVLNTLACKHGWKEPGGHLTIRGQFWAVFALHELQYAYDPAKHTYHIDSALTAGDLDESSSVVIYPHTKNAIVVPIYLYRCAAYSLSVAATVLILGGERLGNKISQPVYLGIGCILLCLFYMLVSKRHKLFPASVMYVAAIIIPIYGFFDIVFGMSVNDIVDELIRLCEYVL